jgi:hypothetical protein
MRNSGETINRSSSTRTSSQIQLVVPACYCRIAAFECHGPLNPDEAEIVPRQNYSAGRSPKSQVADTANVNLLGIRIPGEPAHAERNLAAMSDRVGEG